MRFFLGSCCDIVAYKTVRRGLALAWLVIAALVPLAAAADEAAVEELRREIAELRRTLDALQAEGAQAGPDLSGRIAEIERRIEILAREIESARLAEAAPSAEERGRFGLSPGASKVYAVSRGVSVGGYGEMLYEKFDGTREDGVSVDKKDQLDFLRAVVYFGYKFNDSILFNSEIEYEHASTGKDGEVSVEFAYLDFLLNDRVNVRAGMLLVPVGFINEMHESPVYLGARRPYVEQQIIPSTWRENGVGLHGEAGPVSYRAYLITGLAAFGDTASGASGFTAAGIRDGRSSGSRSAAEDFALVGRVDVRPTAGLLLGAALYSGGADQGTKTVLGESIDARVTIWEAHADWRRRGFQARALYASTSIDDVARINEVKGLTGTASIGEEQYGWYGELGYDVLSLREATKHALVPYVRYERYDTQDAVPAGFAADPANDVAVTTVGLSWKPIPQLAVKLDWNRIENKARTGVDQINASLGYLF